MKVVALVCLLFVAGSCALPESEVAAPKANRIAELFILDLIQRLRSWLIENEWDPREMERHDFNVIIINQLVGVEGFVENFKLHGLSNIAINNLYYNMLLTRLDVDVVMPEIYLSVGKYVARIRYGELDITFELSGTLVIKNIRLRGDALMPIYPRPVINNINPNFEVGSIEAEVTLVGSEDYSETANEFINYRIPAFLATFSREINTIIGEVIREVVNWWWW